jgi:hypothetical protein
LGLAAAWNDLDAIDYLLGKNVDVNEATPIGVTPLMAAAYWCHPEAVNLLLQHGANLEARDHNNQTALFYATRVADLPTIRALLDANADVNVTDARGETPLTIAGDRGDVEVVDLLKDHGAKRTDVRIIPWVDDVPPLTPSRKWALALGAIYDQRQRHNPGGLGGGEVPSVAKKMLKESWKIQNHADLIKMLDGLQNEGHHGIYQNVGAKLAQMSESDFEAYLHEHEDRAAASVALRASYLKWGQKSGLAWDMCRSVELINAGVAAHDLPADEAWDRLMDIAHQAQGVFSSWQELNDNFLDGREIWAGKRDPGFEACSKLLLNPNDPNSPWNQNPWNTDLSN